LAQRISGADADVPGWSTLPTPISTTFPGEPPKVLDAGLAADGIIGRSPADTADLLCYRQFALADSFEGSAAARPPDGGRIANLFIASSLVPAMASDAGNPMFDHPNGYQV
jgi:hypothetical protein